VRLGLYNLYVSRQGNCRYQTATLRPASGWRRYVQAQAKSVAAMLMWLVNTPTPALGQWCLFCLATAVGYRAMFFKRKPKPPLKVAIQMVDDAVDIAYKYLRDKNHMPTNDELQLLDALAKNLWSQYATAQYIARNMGQRSRGEPEGAKKFTDPAVFDYHYPP
jgi:hypothetical protein